MTVPVPLTDIEAAARTATEGPWHQMAAAAWSGTNENPDLVADCPLYADAIHIAATDPPTVLALCEALRIAVNIASEAVGRLDQIGNIYSLAYAADITETEALTQMEVALRGAPPEGDIAFYVLAERLAAVRELVDLGGDE